MTSFCKGRNNLKVHYANTCTCMYLHKVFNTVNYQVLKCHFIKNNVITDQKEIEIQVISQTAAFEIMADFNGDFTSRIFY